MFVLYLYYMKQNIELLLLKSDEKGKIQISSTQSHTVLHVLLLLATSVLL